MGLEEMAVVQVRSGTGQKWYRSVVEIRVFTGELDVSLRERDKSKVGVSSFRPEQLEDHNIIFDKI